MLLHSAHLDNTWQGWCHHTNLLDQYDEYKSQLPALIRGDQWGKSMYREQTLLYMLSDRVSTFNNCTSVYASRLLLSCPHQIAQYAACKHDKWMVLLLACRVDSVSARACIARKGNVQLGCIDSPRRISNFLPSEDGGLKALTASSMAAPIFMMRSRGFPMAALAGSSSCPATHSHVSR